MCLAGSQLLETSPCMSVGVSGRRALHGERVGHCKCSKPYGKGSLGVTGSRYGCQKGQVFEVTRQARLPRALRGLYGNPGNAHWPQTAGHSTDRRAAAAAETAAVSLLGSSGFQGHLILGGQTLSIRPEPGLRGPGAVEERWSEPGVCTRGNALCGRDPSSGPRQARADTFCFLGKMCIQLPSRTSQSPALTRRPEPGLQVLHPHPPPTTGVQASTQAWSCCRGPLPQPQLALPDALHCLQSKFSCCLLALCPSLMDSTRAPRNPRAACVSESLLSP